MAWKGSSLSKDYLHLAGALLSQFHFIPLLFPSQKGSEFCIKLGTCNFSTLSCNGTGLKTMRFYKECIESPCIDYFYLKRV